MATAISAAPAVTLPTVRSDEGLRTDLLLVLAALAAMTVGQGGYYRRVSVMSSGLLALAALVLLGRRRMATLHPSGWVLGGFGVMAGCTLATGGLDRHLARARGPIWLLAELAVVAAVVAGSTAASRRQLADVVVALGVCLAATGWIGVAFRVTPLGHPDGGLWRAATTVTYANASAAILGPLALWALALRTSRDGVGRRAASVLLVVGLVATLSRAGLASFAIGLLVLAGLLGVGPVWRTAAPTLFGSAIAAAALVPGIGAASPARPLWAIPGLAAGLAVGAARWPRFVYRPSEAANLRRRLRLGLLGLLLAGAVAAVIGIGGHSRLWSARLSISSPDRGSLTSVALHMWRTHVLAGVGPGRAVFIWTTADHREVFNRYAHDEYLQLAVEEGAVGLIGLGALGTAVGITARGGWRSGSRAAQRGGRDADLMSLRAGAIAGLACFALHSGFDFLWHIPAVPMIAALAVGLAAAAPINDVPQQEPQP